MITPILSKVNLTTVVHELLMNIKRNSFNVHYLVILCMIVHFIRVCTVPFGGYLRSHNLNLQVAVTLAWQVCSQYSFGLPPSQEEME